MPLNREIIIPGEVITGIFDSRPNRFLVNFYPNKSTVLEQAFLHDPGRLKELLIPAAKLFIRRPLSTSSPHRKTKWDVLAVEYNGELVVVNSRLPNIVAERALKQHWLPELADFQLVRPEISYGKSRLDFLLKDKHGWCYLEVKGVTLIKNGVALFPDAPTIRGTRHLQELIDIQQQGMSATVLFLVMRDGARSFTGNYHTDPLFSHTLLQAYKSGVRILVYSVKPFLRNKHLVLQFDGRIRFQWMGDK